MAKSGEESPLKGKLEEIRRRLIGNPTHEDLQAMQLHVDVLERWARLKAEQGGDHHHDHMDDHDHTSAPPSRAFVALTPLESEKRAEPRRLKSR